MYLHGFNNNRVTIRNMVARGNRKVAQYQLGFPHREFAQRRLLAATRVSTTLEHRVLILNAIVPLGILFTAPVFEPPPWRSNNWIISTNSSYGTCLTNQARKAQSRSRSTLHSPQSRWHRSCFRLCLHQNAADQTRATGAYSTGGCVSISVGVMDHA